MNKSTTNLATSIDSLTEFVSDAVIICDLDFKIQDWNRGAQEIYGWKTHEVFDKPIDEVLRTRYTYDPPQKVKEAILEANFWEGVFLQKHKTGGHRYVSAMISLLFDSEGNPEGA
ncbi:MAG: PAS domain-containing protein [Candidatus Peregrinibacteria bacterium]|nr:PAS domain-containing protein [Candidatus Peregrinibacteria bacterium]